MSAVELLDAGLRSQAEAIAAGDAEPAELLDACLARIEEHSELNAIVETFPERSREMLGSAPRGPLYGVPIAIKDEWPLPWRAERFGAARMLVESSPGESGPYRALRDAGAVIVGVANMHELGSSSTGNVSVYGPARNPWDPERCPGGSSSGPGAAVGGRLVAGAVGADGIGSIRYPAAYCGVTGLKPTFGRASNAGHHIPHSHTIVPGPLCADAGDCRLLGSALFGEELRGGELSSPRIGVLREGLWTDCAPEVREACESALEALASEVGAEVIELEEIEGLPLAPIATVLLSLAEDAAHMTPEKVNAIASEIAPVNKGLLKQRLTVPVLMTERAALVRAQLRLSLARLFESVDLLAWPTVPAVAPPLDNPTVTLPSGTIPADQANPRHCAFANLTGVPAISVPAGLSQGMPVGFQISAAWGRDELLLDAAEALEHATGREFVGAAPAPAG